MNIDTNYILGIADATLDFYNDLNRPIDSEKEVSFYTEPIINNKTQNTPIGCKLYVNYRVNNNEFDDDNQWINIYSKDKISGVISDISDILSDIDRFTFNYKENREF